MGAATTIRNFSIIAHIDHGKSTLADRILQLTRDGRRPRHARADARLDGPRARARDHDQGAGRAGAVPAADGRTYELNLIDTPGHVDFTYEVSRSLAACEGALLVVDAAQGIEAQTLANAYLAIENELEIVPVVNKIDLPSADADGVALEVADLVGGAAEDVLRISAKTGAASRRCCRRSSTGCRRRAASRTRPPARSSSTPRTTSTAASSRSCASSTAPSSRASGCARWRRGRRFEVEELGFFSPGMRPARQLAAGEVGYVITGLKDVSAAARRRHAHARSAAGGRGRCPATRT